MVLGMPTEMFVVFVATVVAGSLGAIHFVIFHLLMGRPYGDEEVSLERRRAGERTAGSRPDTGIPERPGASPPERSHARTTDGPTRRETDRG